MPASIIACEALRFAPALPDKVAAAAALPLGLADKVFLLTPPNIEVSAEERAKALERGGFYNQA